MPVSILERYWNPTWNLNANTNLIYCFGTIDEAYTYNKVEFMQ
ncbi:hypothetical protein [Bacteroides xylanisolvens]|nr:hypothetical protein [Bacteroides xylanisolvens]MDE5406342.1 hypothetical protein [Bacteroides xylanisolvens]